MSMWSRIIRWWNNLSFCKKKKEQWLKNKVNAKSNEQLLKEIRFPNDVFKTKVSEFTESDWVYSNGDRCERYIAWFFKWITKRCTVMERTPEWIPMDTPTGIGGWHPDGYVTAYKVRDDDGNKVQEYVHQNDLSY